MKWHPLAPRLNVGVWRKSRYFICIIWPSTLRFGGTNYFEKANLANIYFLNYGTKKCVMWPWFSYKLPIHLNFSEQSFFVNVYERFSILKYKTTFMIYKIQSNYAFYPIETWIIRKKVRILPSLSVSRNNIVEFCNEFRIMSSTLFRLFFLFLITDTCVLEEVQSQLGK